MQEIWKDIKGYEGHYQVSNLGMVKSLKRKKWNGYGYQILKEKILKQHKDTNGYMYLNLSINGNVKKAKVHRLIAIHFIKNDNNKKEVNHKNGIKTDNRLENLEWVTHKENSLHARDNNLLKGLKPIYMIDKNTNKTIMEFKSLTDACRFLNTKSIGNISKCCNGELNTSHGYKWKYKL